MRRRGDVVCLDRPERRPERLGGYCTCTEEDWECAEGYYRKADGLCEPMDPNKERLAVQGSPSNCTDYYYVPSGYVKSPDSECRRGVDLSEEVYPCPGRKQLKYCWSHQG